MENYRQRQLSEYYRLSANTSSTLRGTFFFLLSQFFRYFLDSSDFEPDVLLICVCAWACNLRQRRRLRLQQRLRLRWCIAHIWVACVECGLGSVRFSVLALPVSISGIRERESMCEREREGESARCIWMLWAMKTTWQNKTNLLCVCGTLYISSIAHIWIYTYMWQIVWHVFSNFKTMREPRGVRANPAIAWPLIMSCLSRSSLLCLSLSTFRTKRERERKRESEREMRAQKSFELVWGLILAQAQVEVRLWVRLRVQREVCWG